MKILVIIASVVFGYGLAYGQFENGCYYPELGTDIDTIYGSYDKQQLGDNQANIGPKKGESYGRIAMYGMRGNESQYTHFQSGPDFDLHKLKGIKQLGINPLYAYGLSWRFGHFRDRSHLDIITLNGRDTIYWADDEGNYDTSRYTVLRVSKAGFYPVLPEDISPPYITYLTSDTVEDLLGIAFKPDTTTGELYLVLFKGGQSLYESGNVKLEDSLLLLEEPYNYRWLPSGIYGDFRGTGRSDGIFQNDSNEFFFYKNDPPFQMRRFADALLYDTLLSRADNPMLYSDNESWSNFYSMQAYRRKDVNDRSVDLLMGVDTRNDSSRSLWIFKGGKEFGSKRLYMDKPDFFIWHPRHYDAGWKYTDFFNYLYDCGDMTGTGNRVLYAGGGSAVGSVGTNAFYVLGDAMNDKADMFFAHENDCGYPDTLVADEDGLQDIIFGNSCHMNQSDKDRGWSEVGYIGLLKGSLKIPVQLNEVLADDEREHLKTTQMYAYPNPLDKKTVLTFENCTSGVMYMDVVNSIGVSVIREEIPDVDGLQQYAADLSALPAGAYHIRLVCPADGWSAGTNVIKTGAAVTPWSLDLKKMVGR